jgi:hypothetical protein
MGLYFPITSTLSDIFSLLPMKDFSFTGPAEMSGFLVNIFDVGGSVHYTP